MPLSVGSRLGRYKIRSKLGEGGMGEVYLAEDTELGRTVALKVLPEDAANSPQRMQRFIQEARAASALNHPNILTIYEIRQVESSRFIATEYIAGETLRTLLVRGTLTTDEVLDIATQAASALAAAHEAGIVHRDIKPENIMVRRDRIVKVLDFGLAKLAERETAKAVDTEAATRVQINTEPGALMGTVAYMSPEQARGQMVDERTDIWSLGCVLYEMVAGRKPFEGKTSSHIIVAILESEPPPLSGLAKNLPPELEEIIMRALRKERDERYAGVDEMLARLKGLRRKVESGSVEPLASQKETLVKESPAEESAHQATAATDIQPGRAPSAKGIEKRTTRARWSSGAVLAALAALALISLAIFFGYIYFYDYGRSGKNIDSIAVLPFDNVGADPNTEYLSDGITESLINSLTQLPDLRVIARSSVFRYKGKAGDPIAFGKELGVRAVLTGRVMQRGDDLTISVELVDVRDNKQLWGAQYKRKLSDILTMQEEITRNISEKLRLRLTGEEERLLTKRYTKNTVAYQLYLKGLYHWNKWDEENLVKSLKYFEQAVAEDPSYALAYAGMAHAHGVLSYYYRPPKDAVPKSRAAALKAIEIDETVAEAHSGLAAIHLFYDWNWAASENECRRAMELNPNNAEARHIYSLYLQAMGRFDEAIEQMKKGQELDPLSLVIAWNLGDVYYYAHRFDEAITEYRKALDLEPNFAYSRVQLGLSLLHKGMYKEGVAELQKAQEWGKTGQSLSALAYGYGVSGNRAAAQKVIEELKELSERKHVPPEHLATAYAGMGDRQQAFDWLQKAIEIRSSIIVFMKAEPMLDGLKSDPRYQETVRAVGLP